MSAQFAEFTERLRALAGATLGQQSSSTTDPQATLRTMLAQTALPLSQLELFVREIASRREQLQTLREQLAVFDQQLETLEQSLLPLVEWGRSWTRLQETMLGGLAGGQATRRSTE